jgi:soluble lytic murein transglycosylase-like protein
LVARHAQANGVPEALVHRVIVRESRYQPHLVGRGGTIGLMQIKLATARGLGYTGSAEGLRDPDTNLTYAVKYLAGAYRAANGDHARAVHYYAGGYYYAAKRQRLAHGRHPESAFASAPWK